MTAPATDDFQATDPTMAVDPLDALIFAMHPMYDHGRNLEATMIALKLVQDVIEAALDWEASGEPVPQYLRDAVAAYRNWRPDAGGGEGE